MQEHCPGSSYARLDSLLSQRAGRSDIFAVLAKLPRKRPRPTSSLLASQKVPPGAKAADVANKQNSGYAKEEGAVSKVAAPVTVLRDASFSIGKAARGASAFLVHIKPLGAWLLVTCPAEVRNQVTELCSE